MDWGVLVIWACPRIEDCGLYVLMYKLDVWKINKLLASPEMMQMRWQFRDGFMLKLSSRGGGG